MLKKSLETLLIFFQLFSTQSAFSSEQFLAYQPQKPPINYEKVSQKDLENQLKIADKVARRDPATAITLYRTIIDTNASLRDEAIGRVIDIYKKHISQQNLDDALSFYDNIIENHQGSQFLPEAYIGSAKILCHWKLPRNITECKARLEKAFEIGNEERKSEALYILGEVEWRYNKNKTKAEAIFTKIIILFPNSEYAQNSNSILRRGYLEKIK